MKTNFSKLYIATDLKNNTWLQYILAEFVRLNRAEFSIRICDLNQHIASSQIIYYSKSPIPGVCVPNESHIPTNGNIEWISEKLFIIDKSSTTEDRFACGYDIFWNAFVFLSRLEEYQFDKKGRKVRSYRSNHPRNDKSTFDVPVVNLLFDELETIIKHHFAQLPFGFNNKPVIELSHDVDYIKKTNQLRLKQSVLNGYNTLKAVKSPSRCMRQAWKTISFLLTNPSYWCFDYWEELEKRHDKRSVFYIFAQVYNRNFKSWLIDPSYDIARNQKLQRKLKQLLKDGFEIGLHGSYYSSTDETMLVQEKDLLESVIEHEVVKVRQHWLRYDEGITPVLHNKHFKYDSTLGWNDHMGFRSGCASRYRPYDHEHQKPFDYLVTPQVIMDSNIFDYGAKKAESLAEKALSLLAELRLFKTSHVSVSWHQRVSNKDYGWHSLYEKILE